MQAGIQTEIYSSIREIAKVTPDMKLEDREGMCRAIITLCDLGEMVQGAEKNKSES